MYLSKILSFLIPFTVSQNETLLLTFTSLYYLVICLIIVMYFAECYRIIQCVVDYKVIEQHFYRRVDHQLFTITVL